MSLAYRFYMGKTQDLAHRLFANRTEQCFPGRLRTMAQEITDALLAVLFPHFADRMGCDEAELRAQLEGARSMLYEFLNSVEKSFGEVRKGVADEFLDGLPTIYEALVEDAVAINEKDPAATSVNEVILSYPGFYAIAAFRLSHALFELGYPLLPRLMTECAHSRTGIDIHPGATIGRRFCIDHGTGVVIGGTAVIGDNVVIYQGVTLGAISVHKGLAETKRHPTIEDDVVIYANATILGGSTVVGKGSHIGGNVWLTNSVPQGAIVTHRADIRVYARGEHLPADYQI